MYVSARLHHAMHALILLAEAEEEMVAGSRLAELEGVSAPYMGGILNELRHGGILSASRGRHGGMRLARPASTISIADVLAALNIWAVDIPDSRTQGEVSERVGRLWTTLDDAVAQLLTSVSLQDVVHGLPEREPASPRQR